jgi:two-component system, cell cycle response regulator
MKTTGFKPPEDARPQNTRLIMEGRRRFVEELGRQLQQLEELLRNEGAGVDTAFRVYNLLHMVKGSAPVFGLIRMGQSAEARLPRWEWTLGEEQADTPLQAQMPRDWQEEAREALQQLTMEREISLEELKWDEHGLNGAQSGNPFKGSRILLIDDDPVLRDYLQRRLSISGYAADEAGGVEEALDLLRQHSYDLIVLDLMMRPLSGYELFEQMKEDPTLQWIPLMVVSGRGDVADKVRCFYLGADDYVTKPFHYEELVARIHSIIARTKAYEQMAFRDPLTGISNRRYFDQQLEQELQRISRYPAPMSIVFLDIDHFKSVNDTYGHGNGDLVLQGLAYLLQQNLRGSDIVARFGGEEFVVVMPGTTVENAKQVMEGILEKVRRAPVATNDGQSFKITFSAGIAEWQDGITKSTWLSMADLAMYAAKQEGRNRVLLFEPHMAAVEGMEEKPARRKKLLIADDDSILRSILVSKFKEQSLEVLEADNGEQALELIRTEEPDAAIIDGMMPKLGGLELLEAMHAATGGSRGMKVLMLSAKGKRKDVLQGLQSGADDYMTKPFSLLELELRVKRLLDL